MPLKNVNINTHIDIIHYRSLPNPGKNELFMEKAVYNYGYKKFNCASYTHQRIHAIYTYTHPPISAFTIFSYEEENY